ncbi:unnamed protein product [Prunus armeniaca]|uniref:Uncharacterized protein n=1 Tax=Prunus armeniaca TaxID=36596 RepID=A0A6J5VBH5_PRUAR|nr:unnamed protein product [Prunus armeniaca]CAB4316004.1 unnamed protein product [Prunus armeniaca]
MPPPGPGGPPGFGCLGALCSGICGLISSCAYVLCCCCLFESCCGPMFGGGFGGPGGPGGGPGGPGGGPGGPPRF